MGEPRRARDWVWVGQVGQAWAKLGYFCSRRAFATKHVNANRFPLFLRKSKIRHTKKSPARVEARSRGDQRARAGRSKKKRATRPFNTPVARLFPSRKGAGAALRRALRSPRARPSAYLNSRRNRALGPQDVERLNKALRERWALRTVISTAEVVSDCRETGQSAVDIDGEQRRARLLCLAQRDRLEFPLC